MTTNIPHPVLKNAKPLVVVIANEHSIAYGCAAAFPELEADLAITHLNEKARPHVERVARKLEAQILLPLDVSVPGELEALFERVGKEWGSSTSSCIPSPGHPRTTCRESYDVAPILDDAQGQPAPK